MAMCDPAAVAQWRNRRSAIRSSEPEVRAAQYARIAAGIRNDVLDMIATSGMGHIGGDFSVADILTVLFHGVLDIDPENPLAPNRDVVILSKGHAAASLYATLASTGFFPAEMLSTFMSPLSRLSGHPAKNRLPGVETSTGPLGHGLPVAVGVALGHRLAGSYSRTVVITGDGELQEGSNWEAIMSASHFALDRLLLIVDRNRFQQGGLTEEINAVDPLAARLEAFGWEVRPTDGHDHRQLESAFGPGRGHRPVAVIAATTKGKGVSFIENRAEWHHKVPTIEQIALAKEQLS